MPGCLLILIVGIAIGVTAWTHDGWYKLLWLPAFAAPIVGIRWLMVRPRLGKSLRRWLWARMGWGHTVEELAHRLDLSVADLRAAKPTYTEVQIAKRSGGRRLLHVPDPATKALQRAIHHRLLGRLRAHPAAHAFERGRSIVTQAGVHVGRAVVIKIDVIDFFPATTVTRIEAYFRGIGWNREAAALLARLTTHAGGLPQGAPTSPRLANLVNLPLDRNIAKLVKKYRGEYTRYADDITISFPEDWPRHVRGIVTGVRKRCKAVGYRIHGKPKLGIYRAHQRQLVCGLVVNQRISLPRERKRWLRAVAHRLSRQQPASLSPAQLAGWTAYLRMVQQGEAKRVADGPGAAAPAAGPVDDDRREAGHAV